ncbi:MAG: hypothetical protein GXP26_12490 [Planctomycetes bacterium]|nr:hypothetical protein [Planctomycetota bacterium]
MNQAKNDPTTDDDALQQQQDLLENSLAAAFSAFDAATEQGMPAPVVFLLDCEDEIGGEIARSWLGDQAVNDAIEQQQLQDADEELDDATTIFAYAFPFEQCRAEVPNIFPYLAPVFASKLPTDGFLAIAVTAGGASVLTVPLGARELGN